MAHRSDELVDATEEQIARLRELGMNESELDELTSEEAEELIRKLESMRTDAGQVGRGS